MVSKRILIAISVFALLPWTQWNAHGAPAAGKTVSVTGCLDKGDEPDEFSIADANGKKYGLRNSSLYLDEYLGHKVTVKGTLKPEAEESEKKEGEEEESNENKAGAKEAGDLHVTAIKMISTCK